MNEALGIVLTSNGWPSPLLVTLSIVLALVFLGRSLKKQRRGNRYRIQFTMLLLTLVGVVVKA